MKPRTRSVAEEFRRRLREARRRVWRTVVRTERELTALEAHQAGGVAEDAGGVSVAEVLSRLDTAERRLLDEIDAAQARLAAGTFGSCEDCGRPIGLPRLRAMPTARRCVPCQRAAEAAGSA